METRGKKEEERKISHSISKRLFDYKKNKNFFTVFDYLIFDIIEF